MTSADEAVTLARSDTAEFKNAARVEAKETTWGTLRQSSDMFKDAQPASTLEVASSEPVWVVAVSGDVVPEYAGGKSFKYGVIVYDAKTSAVLGMSARNGNGDWPQWFAELPDNK